MRQIVREIAILEDMVINSSQSVTYNLIYDYHWVLEHVSTRPEDACVIEFSNIFRDISKWYIRYPI